MVPEKSLLKIFGAYLNMMHIDLLNPHVHMLKREK